ncbi:Uncharacterized protein HZ326_4914, partial [Fusarium oxysporum f. sp. albedinis]
MCGTKDPRLGRRNIELIRTRTPAQVLGNTFTCYQLLTNKVHKFRIPYYSSRGEQKRFLSRDYNNMSEYYNPGIPPEDENRNQTGYQGQNPGQYQDQNNGIQRNQWNPSLSYPGSIEPGRVGFAPNAGPATWGQQPQLHRMPQEHEMEQIHPRNQWHAMKQTNQRNQRNQMQNMYQIPPHIANPAPAPAPASWYGYNHLLHGMDLANMSAIELLNRFPIFFGQPDPAWSNTGHNSDACGGSVSVQNQQHGGQHIAVYPNGSHSNGGYPIHGHATPPPP